MSGELILALEEAKLQLARAERERWRLPSGEPASQHIETLKAQIEQAGKEVAEGKSMSLDFTGMVKWLADWIPNDRDPLMAAIARVERAARAYHR